MYKKQFVRECPAIRAHLEYIHDYRVPNIMVYEWMDTVLADVDPLTHTSDSDLPRLIAREVLKALKVLHENGWIHSDLHMQ